MGRSNGSGEWYTKLGMGREMPLTTASTWAWGRPEGGAIGFASCLG
jgi:hypothetical protein